MILPLAVAVAVAALALAAWAGLFVVRDRAVVLRQLWGGAVVEGLLLIQAISALVVSIGGTSPSEPGLWWGYVVASLLLLPLAALWAFAERSRWSAVVLAIAAVAVVFLQVRLWQIWTPS